MPDFITTLRAAGLRPKEVLPDGRWHRCPTDDKPRSTNGSYRLCPDGDRGFWRNYALDDECSSWSRQGTGRAPITRYDPEAAAAARQREQQLVDVAVASARVFWSALPPLRTGHPYLQRKRLDMRGCGDIRVHGETLVIPITRDSRIVSLQTIDAGGQKRYRAGCPMKGGVHVLDRNDATLTCFVEGFATGLAVFQSIRHCRVVVCFDAGNLVEVARHYQGRGLGVVCADNDWESEARLGVNKGLQAGREAAELMGCGMAYPSSIAGSDWADAVEELGDDGRARTACLITLKAQPFKRRAAMESG